MSRSLSVIPAKPTFSNLRETLDQSDFLERKKGQSLYCNKPSFCGKLRRYESYKQLSLYRKGTKSLQSRNCNIFPANKNNLIAGQYSKMDLTDACNVINIQNICDPNISASECIAQKCALSIPMQINSSGTWYSNVPEPDTATPFYQYNIIDPLGVLFGNTQCGEVNYTSFMVYNPPTIKIGFA